MSMLPNGIKHVWTNKRITMFCQIFVVVQVVLSHAIKQGVQTRKCSFDLIAKHFPFRQGFRVCSHQNCPAPVLWWTKVRNLALLYPCAQVVWDGLHLESVPREQSVKYVIHKSVPNNLIHHSRYFHNLVQRIQNSVSSIKCSCRVILVLIAR